MKTKIILSLILVCALNSIKAKGIYFVKFTQNGNQESIKLIKE